MISVGSLADHQSQELFDDLRGVVETGEPLATQVIQYQNDGDGRQRLVRAYEVRAARVGDGLVVAGGMRPHICSRPRSWSGATVS